MRPLDQYDVEELKLAYRLLHAQLPDHPGLTDSALLQDLQRHLQACARLEGVDVAIHAKWAAWLNNGVVLTVV